VSEGRLYCGFWNVIDDGDGAQPFLSVSTPISRNKTYTVSWVFDYSNYTGPSGSDGSLKCYLNNNSIGEVVTTTRLFPNTGRYSGNIGVGGNYDGTNFHNGTASDDGAGFRGEILEVMITNQSVDETVVETIQNYLLGKWAQEDLSRPNNLAINNNANVNKSPSATWEAIDPNLFNTAYYEVAIGTKPGGTESVYWLNVGNVSTYQVINGVDGASLVLSPGIDYYLSVRAVDTVGSVSQVAISDPWQLFNFNTELTDVVLNLAASDKTSTIDELGADANDFSFSGELQQWLDTSVSTVQHEVHSAGGTRPLLVGDEITFNGIDNLLQVDNSDEINLQTLTEKSITVSFRTSYDTSRRQVIFEEGGGNGGGNRGMNIYIDNNKLFCGFWNEKDDGDGAQDFISLNQSIQPDTDYVVTWNFDYSNYTTPNGEDGRLDCFLNAQFIGSANTTTRIFKHSGAIGIGAQNSGTSFHDGKDNSNQAHYFNGSVRDVIINNSSLREDVIQGLHNYLLNY
ncbi:MAG: hypothetical protein KC478_07770, partial [Bacteriovoracaceae bacterium]|nr:hypothetical protein [Bacteriovoracaceae bacterium]